MRRAASERRGPQRIIIGGLHRDDFQYAIDQESPGYALVAFRLSEDGYRWEAIYEEDL